MPGGTNPTQVSLVLDPRSIDALVERINIAFTEAFTKANKVASAQMAQMSKDVSDSVKHVTTAANNAGTAFVNLGKKGAAAFTDAEKHIIALTDKMLANQHATGIVIRELANLSIAERRRGINAGQAATDAARLQIAQVRNVGIQTNIEGQRAVVVARGVAKSRVLITQGMVRSIILLEKGIGAAIQGVARTTTAALGKIFSGLGGLLRKGNSSVDTEMRRTSQAVEKGMRKTNAEFNTGLNGALNKRESALRSSFRDQEQIVSRSALRQKETLAGLRTGTQTGVLGAANRGLNIGSLVGGIAILQSVRSTFSIGSEFTRGMAVLQAQLNLTGDEMKTVRQLSIDLGNDLTLPGVSALDASEAIQLLAKQFAALGPAAITAAEDAAKGTLQLSRAAGVGAEEAAGVVGAAVNVFGIEASKATDVADQVTAALKNAAGVSFGDFSDAFKMGAGVFASYQKEAVGGTEALVEFNTALAVMARNALVGSDAGTSLKQFFLNATRGTDASKTALANLTERAGETGTAFFDAAEKARPFEQTLDILRRGLKGMTDQQRTTTLQTIFGSDATRTANALLGVSTEEYHKVTQSLREQGLASKIAAAQNTGLKGALDALKSVIETVQILIFEKVNPALGKFVLSLAAAVNVVLFGKGAWADLRIALLGVAAGIGAVLAVKGVVELFQQLGRVVALVLTPLGAFVAVAAVIGGAVFLLAKHSDSFRESLRSLRERLEDFAGVAKDRVVTALHNIRDVIVRDVIPFFKELSKWVGEHLVSAFHAVVDFMTNTVIPALKTAGEFIARIASIGFKAVVDFIQDHVIPTFQSFVEFIQRNAVPVVERVGTIFVNAFDTALEAVQRFWGWVSPVLKPLLDGFRELGGAIAAIFTGGDFSQLGKGFSAVGSGIATSFTGIGKNLLGVLDRLWVTLQTWFKEHFTGAKLIDLGKGFLDLVEFIGHALGTIVTSPTFVRAVSLLAAGLAAAAVLVAGRFIEGFGKALIDHLPGLFHLFTGALLDGLIAAIKNPLIVIGIGLAIAAVLRVVSIVKAFSAAGTAAGGGFLGGLKGSFAKAKFGAQSGLLQFRSIFDGQAFVKYAKEQGFAAGKAMVKEFGRNNALLRTANLPGLQPINPGFLITKKQSAEAIANVEKVRLKLGEAGFAALQSRTNTQSFFAVFRGAKDAIGGIGAAFTANRTAGDGFFKSLSSGFRGAIQEMKRTALLEGGSIGKTLKQGIAAAAGTALAVGGTFIAGKAEGSRGGSGFTSAILGGLTATALTAELGPVSLAIGAATAAAGLLGAAFGRAGKEAADLKAKIKELASTLEGDLRQAIKDGIITLDSIKGHKIDLGDLISVSDKARDDVIDAFKGGLSIDEKDLLISVGVDLGDAADLLTEFDKNGGSLDDFRNAWNNTFLDAAAATKEFRNKVGVFGPEIVGVLKSIAKPGGDADLDDFFNTQAFQELSKTSKDILVDNQDFFDKFLTTASKVTGQSLDDIAKSFHLATADILVTGSKAAADLQAIVSGMGTEGHETPFSGLIEGVKAAIPLLKTAQGESAKFALAEAQIGKTAEEIQADLIKVHLPPLPQTIIDQWTNGLDEARSHAEELQKAVDKIPESISAIGRNAVATPGQLVQDAAVIQVKADTSGFVAAVTDSVNHDFDTPEVRTALAQLGDGVSAAISTAITSGDIRNNPQLLTFIQPLLDAALAGANTDEEKTRIQQLFADIFAGVSIELPADVAKVGAAKFAADVNQFLIDNPFTATINAEFNVAHKNDPNFLQGHGLTPDFNPTATGGLLAGILPTAGETKAAMLPVGAAGLLGVGAGFHDPEARKVVKAQVDSAMHDIVEWAKRKVGARSPSTVMAEVGGFMAQGLANGITAGSTAAATAAEAAAQAAVDAAKGVINGNPLQLDLQSAQGHDKGGRNKDQHINEIAGQFIPSPVPIGVGQASWPEIARQIFGPQGVRGVGAGLADQGPSDIELGALKASREELDSLIALARGLVTTAEQMNKRGPDVTNVSIVEAKDARSTARATIAELRADRMLLKGVR